MPADTVLQLFAKCQFNHSAERIGAVFRSGLRDNLRQAQAVRMVDLDGQDFLAQTLGVYESL